MWIFPDSGSDVTRIYQSRGTTRIIYAPPPDRTPVSTPIKNDTALHADSADSYGVIYVNEVARQSLVDAKKPRFPIGSVIVREKLLRTNDAAPQVLVVMVKRDQGFNSKARDWEFLMIDGDLSKILRREKHGECRDCHVQQRDQDYVFRSYLAADTRARQK